ncbi:uncharacterized protein KQ657_002795 [Scheffersomyces spartinae]|uniref:Glutamyl-tRNA(Gln) amidotransferase subunit B, mitochondrial n=1 Tax=Scheffersomyces spartinae TaxID=45513 RepID=A0A9P7V5M4_9ASCO|nr:uncharacterized protein KQ657_002795 [Scheffersomyces spartinae]KAG7191827.1 hypothetical protein KQ657_002795 [Scheffersomyces spartinae]
MRFIRLLSHSTISRFKLDPNYAFKCGIEIHTQLKTKYKLFSLSPTTTSSHIVPPNSSISYFDIGLLGTQPKLNPEALLLALKLAAALGCEVQTTSAFDRKHYMYPDQPLGYQITQHYHPIAKNGSLTLRSGVDDEGNYRLDADKCINIEQLQIEQDTGKSIYTDDDEIKIDYNRANMPLVELVTKPDFENFTQIRCFLRKYQQLVKYLNICSGDMENGAIRVDVNISVNGGNRVEIKNLGSTTEIKQALRYEYKRQIQLLQVNITVSQETRGWNGTETVKARSKEDAVDYRYVPDSELSQIYLSPTIAKEIYDEIEPQLPERVLQKLVLSPYDLEVKHAKFLLDNNDNVLPYYFQLVEAVGARDPHIKCTTINNWMFHEVLGSFHKNNQIFDINVLPFDKLASLITLVNGHDSRLTLTSARVLLTHVISNPGDARPLDALIEELDLEKPRDVSEHDILEAVQEICLEIIEQNPDVVKKIRAGKAKSINHLVGLAMKESQGKVKSSLFLQTFQRLI